MHLKTWQTCFIIYYCVAQITAYITVNVSPPTLPLFDIECKGETVWPSHEAFRFGVGAHLHSLLYDRISSLQDAWKHPIRYFRNILCIKEVKGWTVSLSACNPVVPVCDFTVLFPDFSSYLKYKKIHLHFQKVGLVIDYIQVETNVWIVLCLLASVVLVGLLCLVLCSQPTRLDAAPLCTNAEAGCHVLSLANLFDRVIQHSARMHGISNDLHSEFVRFFIAVVRKSFLNDVWWTSLIVTWGSSVCLLMRRCQVYIE